MANRRDKLNQSTPFGSLKRIPSAQEMLTDMAPDDGPEPIEMVNIFDILPDPQQPRRAVPLSILAGWNGETASIKTQLLDPWFNAYGHEVGLDYNEVKSIVEAVIWGKSPDREESHNPKPYEASLFKVVELAASIRDQRLINPITIFNIKHSDQYQIETGERRWLAYHLLATIEDAGWFKIPARVIEAPNIWKQAYENNTRDNLNAIAKARQFALLLMDILRKTHHFEDFMEFRNEQDFYAQVADGSRYSIPRGSGEKLVTAIGLQNPRQLRDLRRLLKLPPEIWQEADERNWREGRLRQMLEESGGDDDKLMKLFEAEAMHDDGIEYSVPIGTAHAADDDSVPIGTAESAKHEKASPTRKPVKARLKNAILPRQFERDLKHAAKMTKAIDRLKFVPNTNLNRNDPKVVSLLADYANTLRAIADNTDRLIDLLNQGDDSDSV